MIEVQKLWKGSHYYMYAFSTRLNMCVLCPALRYPGRDRSLIICPNLWDFTGIVRRCWSERRDSGGILPDLDGRRTDRMLTFNTCNTMMVAGTVRNRCLEQNCTI